MLPSCAFLTLDMFHSSGVDTPSARPPPPVPSSKGDDPEVVEVGCGSARLTCTMVQYGVPQLGVDWRASRLADALAKVAAKANAAAALGKDVVTPILPASEFYQAEDYHQDYYKGDRLIITRFGPKSQKKAYKAYRDACGRDARIRQLWGNEAPFAGS